MTAPAQYTLHAYRNGTSSLGYDVVTAADRQTALYHLTSDDTAAGTKQLRKGSEEGPVLATIRSSTDKVDAQITFPTGWSTTIKPGGLYTRKYIFTGFDGLEYSWRNLKTPLAASSLECWAEQGNKIVMTFARSIYDATSTSAEIRLDGTLANQIDLFIATGLAMEDFDLLGRAPAPNANAQAAAEAKVNAAAATAARCAAQTERPVSPKPKKGLMSRLSLKKK